MKELLELGRRDEVGARFFSAEEYCDFQSEAEHTR